MHEEFNKCFQHLMYDKHLSEDLRSQYKLILHSWHWQFRIASHINFGDRQ